MPFTIGSPESRVNTTTAETQNFSAVADIPGFGYVVVWQSAGYNPQFPGETGIFGQRFGYNGQPIGNEFLISPVDNFGFKSDPAVIGGQFGNFTVSWTSFDNNSLGVYQRTLNIIGTGGPVTLVNTTTQGSQEDQQMTRLADGGHVVTWSSSDSDPAFSGVFARRYDANGLAVGNDFKVNTSATSFGSGPAAAGLAGNGYVVAWSAPGVDGTEIYLQRFAADGSKAGGEILVNATTTTGAQRHASVAALTDGGYVVAWTSSYPDFTSELRGQRYDANGIAQGGEFVITDNLANAARPDLTALADGGFAVALNPASGRCFAPTTPRASRWAPNGRSPTAPRTCSPGRRPPCSATAASSSAGTTATSMPSASGSAISSARASTGRWALRTATIWRASAATTSCAAATAMICSRAGWCRPADRRRGQ